MTDRILVQVFERDGDYVVATDDARLWQSLVGPDFDL
jgi:hypothetical protein